jgi:glycosidase
MLDGQFDFPLYDTLMECFALDTSGFLKLEAALRESEHSYGRSTRMSPLFGNHDKPRFMAYADGDLPDPFEPDEEEVGWSKNIQVDSPAAYEKLKMAMTFLMSIDGVPMLYYGDEIGMTGAGDPDNRRMMRFGNAVSDDEASVREHFSKLAKARRSNPALYMGSRRVLEASDDVYAYLRAYGSSRALAAFNRGFSPVTLELSLAPEINSGELYDVINGKVIQVKNGKLRLDLKAKSSVLLSFNSGVGGTYLGSTKVSHEKQMNQKP